MAVTNTPKLNLLRIQDTWQFADDAFNQFIDDADNKLVGVSHLISPTHWLEWQPQTVYAKNDVVRIKNGLSHQYYQCITGGTSDTVMPTNNVTGSIVTDNTVQWQVMSLTDTGTTGGVIQIWLMNTHYNRGDAVLYGTALYRCKTSHMSSNWNNDNVYWQEVLSSIRLWQPNIYYFVDDSVVQDGLIYQCITAHTSANTFNTTEELAWKLIGGVPGAKPWASGDTYLDNQLVTYNGILYRALRKHTAGTSFQADLANWTPVYAGIKEWSPNAYYPLGTIVSFDDIMYKCTTAHTSSTSFANDLSNWKIFHNLDAQVKDWKPSTEYIQTQLTMYNNILYRCSATHTSSSAFSQDTANWTPVYASPVPWSGSKFFNVGDVVRNGNYLYLCNTAHTSQSLFNSDRSKWTLMCSFGLVSEWKPQTLYMEGEQVLFQGRLYRCNVEHESTSGTFSSEYTKWDIVYSNIPEWATQSTYFVGDIVYADNIMYQCTTNHVSTTDIYTDMANWKVFHKPTAFIEDWVSATYYHPNQVVRNAGRLYRCLTVNSDTTFTISKWTPINLDVEDWVANTDYFVGQYVNNGGTLYKCTTANNDATFTPANWQKISGGAGISPWVSGKSYQADDNVIYDNRIYKCITQHTSNTFIGDIANWEVVTNVQMWSASTDYAVGTVVIKDFHPYRCIANHTSGSDFYTDYLANKWSGIYSREMLPVWISGTVYDSGECVRIDGISYRSNNTHKAANTVQNDIANFDHVYANIKEWEANKYYKEGVLVEHDGSLYRCVLGHLAGANFVMGSSKVASTFDPWSGRRNPPISIPIDLGQVETLTRLEFDYDMTFTTTYHRSALKDYKIEVSNDGVNYVTVAQGTEPRKPAGSQPTFTYNFSNVSAQYVQFTVVSTYQNGYFSSYEIDSDRISVSVFDKQYWRKLGSGGSSGSGGGSSSSSSSSSLTSAVSSWQPAYNYAVDDVITYQGAMYKCKTANSDITFDPTKWEQVLDANAPAWQAGQTYEPGTLVSHDNTDGIPDWSPNSQSWAVGQKAVHDGRIYECTTANADADFDYTHWKQIGTAKNAQYKCNTANSDTTFDETKWDELGNESSDLASIEDIDDLFA